MKPSRRVTARGLSLCLLLACLAGCSRASNAGDPASVTSPTNSASPSPQVASGAACAGLTADMVAAIVGAPQTLTAAVGSCVFHGPGLYGSKLAITRSPSISADFDASTKKFNDSLSTVAGQQVVTRPAIGSDAVVGVVRELEINGGSTPASGGSCDVSYQQNDPSGGGPTIELTPAQHKAGVALVTEALRVCSLSPPGHV